MQPYSFPYENAKITLVDTPGFSDTTKSDTEVLLGISTWMSSNYSEGKLLSGIIYLHRITDVRIDGTSLKNFKMLQKMCGPNTLQNVFLTTTQWSNVDQALGEQREDNLSHEDFWGELISRGASLERFMGTRESGLDLISKLMKKEPQALCIQDQMAGEGMALVETDAGKFINDELISLQKKYEKDLGNLERERQNAIKMKDDEMAVIMEQEQKSFQKKLQEVAAERELLTELFEAEMRNREEAERKRKEEKEKNDRAVIAVASTDISITVHITNLVRSYSTKGRLVHDIHDMREFEKDPFDITISYQANFSFAPNAIKKAIADLTHIGVNSNNYITYNKALYRPKPSGPIQRGTQTFHIFTKCQP